MDPLHHMLTWFQHIHETIQPVVQKEVIQPNVVHTTVPIHEVHHNAATHHETTSLPTMTMDQFKTKGGVLSGREERYDEFEGVPKNIGGGTAGGFGHIRDGASHTGSEHHKHGDFNNTPNHAGSGVAAGGLAGSHSHDRHVGTDGVIGREGSSDLPRALTEDRSRANLSSGHNDSLEHKKPGLMDKLNPKKDADGDGKAGFMK
jgi:hypothetical protein